MEAFSLLNYWKGGDGGGGGGGGCGSASSSIRSFTAPAGTKTTTVVTSVSDDDADADDDGPFFDLDFAVPREDKDGEDNHDDSDEEVESNGGEADGEEGIEGDSDCTDGRVEDPNLVFSPSDDIFFNGHPVTIEPSSSIAVEANTSVKAPAVQFSASLLKSATKFRVFILGLKKSKLNHAKSEKSETQGGDKQKSLPPPQQKNTLTVKLNTDEVPIISLITRNNSSRNSPSSSPSSSSSSSSSKKQNGIESANSDDKRFIMMQKYLKKVKPFYIRVSRRYGDKLRFSGQLSVGSGAPAKSQKPLGSMKTNIPAGFKVVKKHLGKSRSSSSATPIPTMIPAERSERRDDSLLQQQDGIQSAILHCKISFNSSRGGDSSAMLARSVSDPFSYDT